MRLPIRWLMPVIFVPTMAAAQGRPIVEIGTNLGFTIQSAGGTLTHFGIPGEGILGQPTIYASIFGASKLFVEPQVALNVISGGGTTASTIGFSGQVGYLVAGPDANSAFVTGDATLQAVSVGGVTDSEFAIGGRVGYRAVVGSGFALRVEAGYRRWLDSQLNELRLGLGIGGVVRAQR